MENCGFHSQLVSVMEVLAKAAVAEINRRVDESCAVLRLEVSASRRDIDLLKRKCEVMEAELRRSRMRARRRGFHPAAAERFSPSVKVVLSKGRQNPDWGQVEPDGPTQVQQGPPDEEHVSIKEEFAEEDVWKDDSEDKLVSAAEPPPPCFASPPPDPTAAECRHQPDVGYPVSPTTGGYEAFPEQAALDDGAELVVKQEQQEVPDENAAPLDPAHRFEVEDGAGWIDGVDPSFLFAGPPPEPVPEAAAAAAKRRGMMLDQTPQQYGDGSEGPAAAVASAPFHGFSRGGFGLAGRKLRTPWRSGVGEKRFGCTFCDKTFMRFSQLKEHLRSHTGEKPFSCLQCGRSFTKQCNLIRHAVVHSGEKPHQCALCGKCFTQRSSLKSHQKTAH